eukprot:m.473818 g.473818  ORF g.473818 m.473818 type:complete len:59 (+) comp21668_c0_seq1:1820-1996(+)
MFSRIRMAPLVPISVLLNTLSVNVCVVSAHDRVYHFFARVRVCVCVRASVCERECVSV